MSKSKVVVLPESNTAAIELMSENCVVCEGVPDPYRDEILTKAHGVDDIFCEPNFIDLLDGDVLHAADEKLADRDYVDAAELQRRDVAAGPTPTVLSGAVADTAVGLMLAAARRFHEGRLKIENNEWERGRWQWMVGQDVIGATVGIVGLGCIGQTIIKRLQGFDVGRFLYTGHSLKAAGQQLDAVFVSFDTLLRESDFVFVTCPITEETAGMFDAAAFSKMKPTSVFVNVSSSDIVVQDALVEALRSGVIFAAGLDVMTLPFDHPLLQLSNCVIVIRE